MASGHRPNLGITVSDGTALVMGAAVAAVLVPGPFLDQASGLGWVLIALTFAGLSLTAAGPFLWLARLVVKVPVGGRQSGLALWAVLGLPWILSALIRTINARRHSQLADLVVLIGVVTACIHALVVVGRTWLPVPERSPPEHPGAHWTDLVGTILAVAWPLQCALALILLGNHDEPE